MIVMPQARKQSRSGVLKARTAVQNPDRQRVPSGSPVRVNKAEKRAGSVDPVSLWKFVNVDTRTKSLSTPDLGGVHELIINIKIMLVRTFLQSIQQNLKAGSLVPHTFIL